MHRFRVQPREVTPVLVSWPSLSLTLTWRLFPSTGRFRELACCSLRSKIKVLGFGMDQLHEPFTTQSAAKEPWCEVGVCSQRWGRNGEAAAAGMR